MSLEKSVSYCFIKDAFEAGKISIQEVMEKLNGKKPDILILFNTIGYNIEKIIDGIYSQIDHVIPVVGCTGSGVITSQGTDEAYQSLGLMGISCENIRFTPFIYKNLSLEPFITGTKIGNKINSLGLSEEDKKLLILLADGLTVNSSELLKGIKEKLGYHIDCVGGTAGHDYQSDKTYQFCNKEIYNDAVTGFVISGDFNYAIEVSHGSKPIGGQKIITKSKGNIIYEIDNEPVNSIIEKFWGERKNADIGQNLNLIGLGEAFEGMGYSQDIIIRAVLGLEDGFIRIGTTLTEGTRIYITRRDKSNVKEKTQIMGKNILKRMKEPDNAAYFYFNCTGRGTHLYGNPNADVDNLMEILEDKDMIGFYTFGEFAPVKGMNYFHNYTGVLVGIE